MSKTIVKKSSEIEEFSESKLKKSIINAFKAVSMGYSKKLIDNIISQLVIEDKTSSNDIRNQLEVILMNSGYYNVAKAFIAYEQKKLLHDRDVNDRIDFIKKYCESINSASGSQFDANANVDNKNIATLIGEIPKGMFIKINRKLLYNKIKKLYGKKTADKYIKLLKEHHLYKNDETSINSYTYAGSNIIYVFSYENNDYFDISIKNFYDNLGIDEVCVDTENKVYQKIPTKLYVKDRNGKVKVTALTKKKCHRAMYKITFVDDSIKPLIVTDNHPLIVDEDKNNTITADKITNKQSQFIINQRKWVEIKSCEKVEDFKDEYIYDITTESETLVVNNIWCHNCASITMYPWLLGGTKDIGGNSTNPTNLKAFCGGLVNMVFMVSSMLSGACSTPEFLMYMTHFLEQEYGEEFYKDPEKIVDLSKKQRTIDKVITDCFEQVVYSLNQPTGARNFQCVRETTELWTPEGFKKLSELKEDDLCYVWKDGHYDIEPIKKLNVYDYDAQYDGELYIFVGDNYQQTVTPNHRVLHEVDGEYIISKAEDLANLRKNDRTKQHIYNLPITADNNLPDYDISYDELINISKEIAKNCINIPTYFAKLSKLQARTVINTICDIQNDVAITSKNLDAIKSLQSVALLAEYSTKIDTFKKTELNEDLSKGNTYEEYKLNFIKNKKTTSVPYIFTDYFYKGKVWCPTTDAGVVVFREENNVPYISGNSVFWNIAYYDQYYFNSLFENFVFPDGSKPHWESVSWLQKRFMKWFNQERKKTVLTFPVETMAMLYEVDDKGKVHFKDQEYEDFTAEMYSEGHSFFTYLSDRADSLSSCCFSANQDVMIKHDEYGIEIMEIKKAYHLWNEHYSVYHNGKWKKAKAIRLPARQMYRISTDIGQLIDVSDNHLNPTDRGDIRTDELTTDDYLKVEEALSFIDNNEVIAVNHRNAYKFKEKDGCKYVGIMGIIPIKYNHDYIYCFEMEDQDDPYFTLPNGIITHNCRLRNELTDNTFSYTLGAGGVSSGSKSVLTININRVVQWASKNNIDYKEYLTEVVDLCHKVQTAYNDNLKDLQNAGMLPLYDAGYIAINRQYLTIGVNGIVEAAEFLGLDITDNPKYAEFVESVLSVVENLNKQYRTKELMFNCEMIPAENVGVKHAKWDKEDGYFVPRDCYNSYFYRVEDKTLTIIDKIKLHGKKYIQHLTGGSALHLNLEEHLSKEQYKKVLEIAAKEGCNYLTFNIPNTLCNDCGNIDKRYLKECPKCHSKNIDYLTRIIGYLKRISNFSEGRQVEAKKRNYHNANKEKTEISSVK